MKILTIIEKTSRFNEYYLELFEDYNFEIIFKHTVEDAIKWIEENNLPEAIILDHFLPYGEHVFENEYSADTDPYYHEAGIQMLNWIEDFRTQNNQEIKAIAFISSLSSQFVNVKDKFTSNNNFKIFTMPHNPFQLLKFMCYKTNTDFLPHDKMFLNHANMLLVLEDTGMKTIYKDRFKCDNYIFKNHDLDLNFVYNAHDAIDWITQNGIPEVLIIDQVLAYGSDTTKKTLDKHNTDDYMVEAGKKLLYWIKDFSITNNQTPKAIIFIKSIGHLIKDINDDYFSNIILNLRPPYDSFIRDNFIYRKLR